MANVKITELTAATALAGTDVLPIVDVGADATKKVSVSDLLRNLPDGTASAPALAFADDQNTGVLSPGDNSLAFATSGTQRLVIDSSGQVGIGTTSPQHILHLHKADSGTNYLQITNSTTGSTSTDGALFGLNSDEDVIVWQREANNIQFGTNNAERVRIDSSGNLGIGTTSPENNLHIADTSGPIIRLTNSTGTDGTYTGRISTGDAAGTFFAGINFFKHDTNDGEIRFRTKVDGTNQDTVTIVDGRVGIGTTSPTELLHTVKSSGTSRVRFEASAAHSFARLVAGSTSYNSGVEFFSGTTNTANITAEGDGELVVEANGSERMRIDSSGNVGIGNTVAATIDGVNSAGTLVVGNGSSAEGVTIYTSDSTAGELAFADGTSGSATQRGRIIYSHGDNSMRFSTDASEAVRIDTSGNVGIGTTSPGDYDLGADDLVVANSGNGGVSIITGTSSVGALYFGDGTSSNQPYRGRVEYKHAEDSLNFGSAGTLHATLDSSGRLLVGASSSRGGNFNNGSGVDSQFLLEGTSFVTSFANIVRNSNDANSAGFALSKSRGTSVGSNTIVQNNDKLGEFAFQGSDGAKLVAAAAIECQVDGTPGTSDMPGRLVFSTTADGASSSTERMRITSNTDGQLLLGTTSGSNSSSTGVKLKGGSASSVDVVINAASNINLNHVYNVNATNNGYRFYIQANGGIVNHSGNNTNLSDEREKKNIADMDSAWSDLKQWVLREFHFNDEDDSDPKHYGVIAQQVETVSPEVISDFQKDETTTRKGVKEMQMMWMAIKALQEAQARIETLETKVAALEAQ